MPLTPPFPTPASPPGPARRLGKYEVLNHIATGGMAELHLARATGIEGFEKLVVLKMILPHLATNEQFVQMFLDEARIAATLHHSNIVQVYDIGSAQGSFFFAMEHLQGEDVARVMKALRTSGRSMPVEHALTILVGACAGLHYAHEKRGFDGRALEIVHRDVSPQNIFVTYDGGVKLVDFGIAKAKRRLAEETRSGTLKGKVRYMSPEQCKSGELDRRSDIYALSIVLWELTTGQRLYAGATEFEVLRAIAEGETPKPSTVKPDYPPDLERVVMKGLEREPAARYQTTEELQLDLEAFAREHKLSISSVALARFMRDLFGDRARATPFVPPSSSSGAQLPGTVAFEAEPPSTEPSASLADLSLEPHPRHRWLRAGVIAVLCLAAAAAALAWRHRGDSHAAVQVTLRSAHHAAKSNPPAAPHAVTLRSAHHAAKSSPPAAPHAEPAARRPPLAVAATAPAALPTPVPAAAPVAELSQARDGHARKSIATPRHHAAHHHAAPRHAAPAAPAWDPNSPLPP